MKVLGIIQARMGSERLPGKVMKKILGEPMISYTIDRALKSRYMDQVVLATSQLESEKPMVSYLKDAGYSIFQGSEDNVLERYIEAANTFKGDILVRITGDCPFIDPTLIDYVISYYFSNDYDYVAFNIPDQVVRGFDVEVFSKKKLEEVYEIVKNIEGHSPYKEHVTLYMYRHPEQFSVSRVSSSTLYQRDYRLCVDTKEDFELVNKVYEHFQDKFVPGKEVVKYLDEHEEIASINKEIEQKYV